MPYIICGIYETCCDTGPGPACCSACEDCISSSCTTVADLSHCGDPLISGTGYCCSGVCKDLQNDNNNCGNCGVVCNTGAGEECCDGICVDTNTDPNNCGGCGNVCTLPLPDCFGGTCVA